MVMLDPKPDSQSNNNGSVLITFQSPGSAVFDVRFSGPVTATQLLALGEYLSLIGKSEIQRISQMNSIQPARLELAK